ELRDAAGNLETGDNATVVAFAKTVGAGSVTGLGTSTASGGVASKAVSGLLAGSITVTASAGSLTDATTFVVVPGARDHLTLTSSTADLAAGTTRTLTAEVRDAAGNLETGDNGTVVTFAKTSGTGTLTGLAAATVSGGVASQT